MSKNKSPTSASYNSSGGEGDDARKKRGNSQDEREAFKKVRSEAKTSPSEKDGFDRGISPNKDRGGPKDDTSPSPLSKERSEGDKVWDLESAILYLVQIGNAGDKKGNHKILRDLDTSIGETIDRTDNKIEEIHIHNGDNTPNKETTPKENPREYLTKEETSWITFRAAHAGDASAIAQWYRKQQSEHKQRKRKPKPEEPEIEKQPPNEEETNNSTESNNAPAEVDDASSSLQLEHWLAEGLGDENNCPFVHGLLAYVSDQQTKSEDETDTTEDKAHTKSDSAVENPLPAKAAEGEDNVSGGNTSHHHNTHLAAVVMMSLSWAFGRRTLKIEWMFIDSSFRNARQKVWLRIHTLSSMTACKAISVDEELLKDVSELEQSQEQKQEEEPLEGGKASTRKNHLVEPSAE